MPKGEHTIVSTTLGVSDVKGILSSVLSGANVEPLNRHSLDGDAALAIVASQRGGAMFNKSPFGAGNAVAQVIVEDHGSTRSVELIAIKDTFADSWNRQRAAGNAVGGLMAMGQAPNVKGSRKMAEAILQRLKAADPSLRQTH